MKKTLLSFGFSLLLASGLMAQQRPLGTWESFPPYNSALQVVQSDDRIYCAAEYSVFYVDKADGSTTPLTKTTGLSDTKPTHLAYHAAKNTLVITYNTSNIDLLVNGTDLYNIPDIKNTNVGSSKTINDVEIIGQYAYLATDLGISVLDLDKKEIKENYIIGDTGQSVKVYSITSDGTTIFAATDQGVKSAPLSSSNLQNYTNWTIYLPANGLPRGAASLVGQIGGRFYAVVADSLYVLSGGTFTGIRYDAGFSYHSFSSTGTYMYAFLWDNGSGAKTLRISPDGTIAEVYFADAPRPNQIVTSGTDQYIADTWGSLLHYRDTVLSEHISLSGPPSSGVFRMAAGSDNTLYLAAGGTNGSYITYNYDRTGPVVFDHTNWKSYNINFYGQISNAYDLVDIAVDEIHDKVYYASLRGGIVEYNRKNGEVTAYDNTNTNGILQPQQGDASVIKVSALCVDGNGNLWMSNTGTPRSLVVKTAGGTWANFSVPYDVTTARQMVADDYGQIWIGGRGNNMVVYNPGYKVEDPSDDSYAALTNATGSGGLPNTNVWSIAKDKNGDIWVGTDVGIGTFYCAGSATSSYGCDATRIKVDQGGFIGYLFSTEIVQAIAVDGANRKWIGSTNGVWLISDDGTKQLLHFTSDNSPLPSNNITSITVCEKSGEVFIGTDLGLVSYQGDAILGDATKGKPLVYPNPVRPDYTGPIAIKGLVDNAYVKILDAGGILVYQGRANGGQMIWDGKGYNGSRVETGVYFVYAATDLGKEHNVGKVVFIH